MRSNVEAKLHKLDTLIGLVNIILDSWNVSISKTVLCKFDISYGQLWNYFLFLLTKYASKLIKQFKSRLVEKKSVMPETHYTFSNTSTRENKMLCILFL